MPRASYFNPPPKIPPLPPPFLGFGVFPKGFFPKLVEVPNFFGGLSSKTLGIFQLLKKIWESFKIFGGQYISIYGTYRNYYWFLGLYNNIEGEFITHTGFGSIGAIESLVNRYTIVIGSLGFRVDNRFRYGLNLREVYKYRTTHNYSIGEVIEIDNIFDYFDNRYTKKSNSLAFDIGGVYTFNSINIGFSILDIGDTSFGNIGKVKSSSNIGISTEYQDILFGIDYIDIFNGVQKDSFRFGVSKNFGNLTLNSGFLGEDLTFGVDYKYSIFKLSCNRYDGMYQLLISMVW